MATPDTMAKVAESEAQCPKSAAERQLSAGSNAPGSAPEQRPVSQSGSVLFLDPEMVLDLAPKRGVRVLSAKGHRGDASRLKADLRALQRRVLNRWQKMLIARGMRSWCGATTALRHEAAMKEQQLAKDKERFDEVMHMAKQMEQIQQQAMALHATQVHKY